MELLKALANILNQLSKALLRFGSYLTTLDPRINGMFILLLLLTSLYCIVVFKPIWKILWTFIFAISFHQLSWVITQIQKLPIPKK